MAKQAQIIAVPTDLDAQIIQATSDTGLTADNIDIFEASDGTFYREIGSRTKHTTIAKIRAMGGTGIPDANPNIVYKTTDFGIPGDWTVDSSDSTTEDDTGSCLVTAGGTRVKRKYDGKINVISFGAKADGNYAGTNGTDNSTAFTNAIAYANTLLNVVVAGSTSRVDSPIIFIPNGIYKFSNPLTNIIRSIKIEGNGSFFVADTSSSSAFDQDNFFISGGTGQNSFWVVDFKNFNIFGFDKGINIDNGNVSNGNVLIEHVNFLNCKSCIQLNCRSTSVKINKCEFSHIINALNITLCDWCLFKDCIVKLNDFSSGDYFISSAQGSLYIDNMYATPGTVDVSDMKDCAWLKLTGTASLICRNSRFGHEHNGMMIADINVAPLHTALGTFVCFYNSYILGFHETSVYAQLPAPVLLRNVPNKISIKDCLINPGEAVVSFHPDEDGETIISNLSSDNLNYSSNMSISVSGNIQYNVSGSDDRSSIGDNIDDLLKRFSDTNRKNTAIELVGSEIDFSYWDSIYQSISVDTIYTISNEIEGRTISFLVINSDTSDHAITITGYIFYDGSNSFTVPAGGSVACKLEYINGNKIGWVNKSKATTTKGIRIVTESTTITTDDCTVICDAHPDYPGDAITWTLPDADTCEGQIFKLANWNNANGGDITLAGANIKQGSLTGYSSLAHGNTIEIQSNGTDYWLISFNTGS